MTDTQKKLAVVAVGLVVFGGAVVYRSLGAVVDVAHERLEAEAACEAKVQQALEAPSPLPGYRAASAYRRTTPPPAGTRLATLRLPGRVSDHRRILESDTLQYTCLYRAAVALGGNTYVMERIETSPNDPARGDLVEGVYLVTAPTLPPPLSSRFPSRASLVTDVFPGSPAEAAGLRPADVPVDLDGRRLGEGRGENSEVDDAVVALPDGATAVMTVFRTGQLIEVPVRKTGGLFGYRHIPAPFTP